MSNQNNHRDAKTRRGDDMGEPIDQQKLNDLSEACWAHHAWVKGLRCNCNFKHPDPNDFDKTLPTKVTFARTL